MLTDRSLETGGKDATKGSMRVVRRQRGEGKNVGKSLYCGFCRKEQVWQGEQA